MSMPGRALTPGRTMSVPGRALTPGRTASVPVFLNPASSKASPQLEAQLPGAPRLRSTRTLSPASVGATVAPPRRIVALPPWASPDTPPVPGPGTVCHGLSSANSANEHSYRRGGVAFEEEEASVSRLSAAAAEEEEAAERCRGFVAYAAAEEAATTSRSRGGISLLSATSTEEEALRDRLEATNRELMEKAEQLANIEAKLQSTKAEEGARSLRRSPSGGPQLSRSPSGGAMKALHDRLEASKRELEVTKRQAEGEKAWSAQLRRTSPSQARPGSPVSAPWLPPGFRASRSRTPSPQRQSPHQPSANTSTASAAFSALMVRVSRPPSPEAHSSPEYPLRSARINRSLPISPIAAASSGANTSRSNSNSNNYSNTNNNVVKNNKNFNNNNSNNNKNNKNFNNNNNHNDNNNDNSNHVFISNSSNSNNNSIAGAASSSSARFWSGPCRAPIPVFARSADACAVTAPVSARKPPAQTVPTSWMRSPGVTTEPVLTLESAGLGKDESVFASLNAEYSLVSLTEQIVDELYKAPPPSLLALPAASLKRRLVALFSGATVVDGHWLPARALESRASWVAFEKAVRNVCLDVGIGFKFAVKLLEAVQESLALKHGVDVRMREHVGQ
ncbi:unnamed protein product, partial [Polarella glacialis]